MCRCKFDGSTKYDSYDLPFCEEEDELQVCAEQVEEMWLNDNDECECPLERCDQTKYQVVKSSSRWPGDKNRALDWSSDEDPNEYVQSYLYFQEFAYEEFTEVPNSNFVAMLSAIGGSLGLCLGMSLISFGELMELCSLLLIRVDQRRKAKAKTRRAQEEEKKRRLLSEGSESEMRDPVS